MFGLFKYYPYLCIKNLTIVLGTILKTIQLWQEKMKKTMLS